EASASTIGGQMAQQYLDGLYLGFNDLKSGFSDAADGAEELAGGTEDLDEGVQELDGGAQQLDEGPAGRRGLPRVLRRRVEPGGRRRPDRRWHPSAGRRSR